MSDDTPTQRFGAPDEEPPPTQPAPRQPEPEDPAAAPAGTSGSTDTGGLDDVDAMSQWFLPSGTGVTEVQPTVPPADGAPPSDPLSWLNDGRSRGSDDPTAVFPAGAATAGAGAAGLEAADAAATRYLQPAYTSPGADQYAATTAVTMGAAEGGPSDRSKRLIIILGAAGAVLLAAIITLLVIAFGAGVEPAPVGDPSQTPSTTPSQSATPSRTPTPSQTPTETPTPTPTPTPTVAPPPAAPTISAFTVTNPAVCTAETGTVNVNAAWTTANASAVKITVTGSSVSATGAASSNTTITYDCAQPTQQFVLTATGANGTTPASATVTVNRQLPATDPGGEGTTTG